MCSHAGFFVSFSAQSGGIFVDMGIHDVSLGKFHVKSKLNSPQIDIARYYLDVTKGCPNPKKQVNRVFAVGQTAVYGDLKQYADADNGFAIVEFANGKVLTFHVGRTLTNGFEGATRVFGTKGSAIINGVSCHWPLGFRNLI